MIIVGKLLLLPPFVDDLKVYKNAPVFSMTGLTYAHSCYLQSQWMETCEIILQTCGCVVS